jgi:hypothetical protein
LIFKGSDTMTLTDRLTALRDDLREEFAARREQQRQHRQLEQELAAFSTPAERLELDLILARHTADEARDVQAILHRQAYDRLRGQG